MKISDILGMSLTNLWRRKMRTFLTVLGVIIGTASIVVMLSLGIGLKKAMMDQVNSQGGLTEIYVDSDSEIGLEQLLLDDKTIKKFEELEHVEDVTPMLMTGMPVQAGKYEAYFEVVGTEKSFLEKINVGEGKLPEKKGDMLELVLGNQLLSEFYDSKTGEYPYWENGEYIDVDLMKTSVFAGIEKEENDAEENTGEAPDVSDYYDSTFSESADEFEENDEFDAEDETETDFMEEEGGLQNNQLGGDTWDDDFGGTDDDSMSYSMFTGDTKKVPIKISGIEEGDENSYSEFQYSAYADIEALKNFFKKNYGPNEIIPGQPTDRNGKPYRDLKYTQLVIRVDKAKYVEEVLQAVQDMGYRGSANKEWIEETEKEFLIIEAVLGGIGAVAMLVAAISIANTMTMSTYERTKEIGIMKVLGCNLSNIRSMFLTEAAFIGFLGGIAGVGLSFILSAVLNKAVAPMIMAAQFEVNANISVIPIWLVFLSIVFAALVGMLAGFFPAQRATKLSPLAAIRNE